MTKRVKVENSCGGCKWITEVRSDDCEYGTTTEYKCEKGVKEFWPELPYGTERCESYMSGGHKLVFV